MPWQLARNSEIAAQLFIQLEDKGLDNFKHTQYLQKGGQNIEKVATRNHILVDHITDDEMASIFTFFRQEKKKVDCVIPVKPNGEGAESLPMIPTETFTSSPSNKANTEIKWQKLLKQSTEANKVQQNDQAREFLEEADLEGFQSGEYSTTPRQI